MMTLLICLLLCVVFFSFIVPFIRFVIKRIILTIELSRMCHRKGFVLYPLHPFWMLGGRYGTKCDFCIETKESVLFVKLFDAPSYRLVLVFGEDFRYCFRRMISVARKQYPEDGKQHYVRSVDYLSDYKSEWKSKEASTCSVPTRHAAGYQSRRLTRKQERQDGNASPGITRTSGCLQKSASPLTL